MSALRLAPERTLRLLLTAVMALAMSPAASAGDPPAADPASRIAVLASQAKVAQQERRYADAEAALALRLELLDRSHASPPLLIEAMDGLANVRNRLGDYRGAERLLRKALGLARTGLAPNDRLTMRVVADLGYDINAQGRYLESEPLLRRALREREQAFGPLDLDVADSAFKLADSLNTQGRYVEAEPLYRRSLSIRRQGAAGEALIAASSNSLGFNLFRQDKLSEAEEKLKKAQEIRERLAPGSDDTAITLKNLGLVFDAEGKSADADGLLRSALRITEHNLGPGHPSTARDLNNLGLHLVVRGEYAEANERLQRALAIRLRTLGPNHINTLITRTNLGTLFRLQGEHAAAVDQYRLACAAYADRAATSGRAGSGRSKMDWLEASASVCNLGRAQSLWGWAKAGGGAAGHSAALMGEALESAQAATLSSAGDALARTGASLAAERAGAGALARRYEAELTQRDALDQAFSRVAGDTTAAGANQRREISAQQASLEASIDQLSATLARRYPRFWDLRSPRPVGLKELQGNKGLLGPDEALVLMMIPPGQDHGLVFAVSRDSAGWAQIGLSGDQIRDRVRRLRAQIDPQAYGIDSAGAPRTGHAPSFDRTSSWELYHAIFGDPAIAGVIAGKPILLVTPGGPMTSLPPGVLVTRQPADGGLLDDDPSTLRATDWLLKEKALAVLPAVSSLRTLRAAGRGEAASSSRLPLIAFAEPDFRGPGDDRLSAPAVERADSYSGDSIAERLRQLPSLDGLGRIEAERLNSLLGEGGEVIMGPKATETAVKDLSDDGELARAHIVEFATHGLISGDFGLVQPALALAHPANGSVPARDDGLLTAGEVAGLRMDADWVILSACNTAAPDLPEAQGLSGLSRAFFYAGARSLLVSHWRVRNDVAPRLTPSIIMLQKVHPRWTRAMALQQASLDLMRDRDLPAAWHPSAWAAFVLVGDGR